MRTLITCFLISFTASFLAAQNSFFGIMEYADSPASLEVVGGQWDKGDFDKIEWRISDIDHLTANDTPTATTQPAGFDWYYEYTITTGAFTPQAFLIQTHDGAVAGGFDNFSVQKSDPGTNPVNINAQLGTYTTADFTSLPAPTYGLAFTDMGGRIQNNIADVTTISFWSVYAPALADFFANCGGGGNRAWNTSFGDAEGNDKILGVPEPAHYSLVLALAAIAFIGFRKKRPF